MNEPNLSDESLAELLSLTVTVNEYGTYYRNKLGQLHRTHGPAVVYGGGGENWYQNGRLHRTDGPAVEWSSGLSAWYLNGEYISQKEFNERTQSL